MRMNFQVGIGGLLAKIAAVKGRMTKDALEEIATVGADIFEAEAKQLCPVLTGALRNSIHKLPAQAKGPLLVTMGVAPDTPYALRTEWGHAKPTAAGPWPVHQRMQPYMRPAYDGKRDEARRAMVERAREILLGE